MEPRGTGCRGSNRAEDSSQDPWGPSPAQRAERARERLRARSAFGLSLLVHGLALVGVLRVAEAPAGRPEAPPMEVVWIDPAPTAAGESKPAPAPPPANPAAPPMRPNHAKPLAKTLSRPDPTPRLAMPAQVARARSFDAPIPAVPTHSAVSGEPSPEAPRESARGAVQEGAPARPAAPQEPPRFNADYLRNPPPAYPASSRRRGEEGRVLLRVQVMADGHPALVLVHASCGFERLDNAALEAVRHWQFVPARQGGDAVADWVIVPVHFSLKESG